MAGLVPAISLREARGCHKDRDRRDKPGDDEESESKRPYMRGKAMQQLEAAGAWLGRLLLAAIFLHEAWAKLTAYGAAVAYMQAFGLPGWLLPFAIAVELGCGVLVIAGFYTRAAALVLALFCLATA